MFQGQRKLDKASLGFGFLSLGFSHRNVQAEVKSSVASIIAKMTNNWPKNKAGTTTKSPQLRNDVHLLYL